MAFHCGAPTRDGSPCQRHVREPGIHCSQHRDLGGGALRRPRHAMRTVELADPALTAGPTAWTYPRAGGLRDRVTPAAEEESGGAGAGSLDDEKLMPVDAQRVGRAGAGEAAESVGPQLYLDWERSRGLVDVDAEGQGREPELSEPEVEAEAGPGPESRRTKADAEPRPVEQRPLLRKERALDPDWIGARPLFRDETPTRPLPRIEFEPSNGADAGAPRKPPRMSPLRSVVLNPQPEPVLTPQAAGEPASPDPDPPTLIDRMPPIDPDDLVVPDFLRPGFTEPEPTAPPQATRPPLPQRVRKPRPAPAPDPDPPTLIDPHPPIAPEDISVPDFVVPGFSQPAPKPPLRTVLSTVLGPELWERCYAEWGPAHCTSLARIARNVDGLAPSAGTAVRSTAGAGMRWLGVARERQALADQVAGAISHPADATVTNQARTVRLYGAAICMALNVPLRRCACHRDLERDVSGELIRLGLEELAGEVT